MIMDLEKFFEEKQIPYKHWEIEHKGFTHFIDTDMVIDEILATEGNERLKIEGVIFKLDFNNASISDYLHYLAKYLIVSKY